MTSQSETESAMGRWDSGSNMPPPSRSIKTAEIRPAVANHGDNSRRRQPSQGGRRMLWWKGRGTSADCPPQKQHTNKAGGGSVPAPNGRVYLNGTDSKLYLHLPPSTTPCTTISFRRCRRRHRPTRRVHPNWPLPGLSMATTTTTIQQLGLVPAPRGGGFPPRHTTHSHK